MGRLSTPADPASSHGDRVDFADQSHVQVSSSRSSKRKLLANGFPRRSPRLAAPPPLSSTDISSPGVSPFSPPIVEDNSTPNGEKSRIGGSHLSNGDARDLVPNATPTYENGYLERSCESNGRDRELEAEVVETPAANGNGYTRRSSRTCVVSAPSAAMEEDDSNGGGSHPLPLKRTSSSSSASVRKRKKTTLRSSSENHMEECYFVGDPVPEDVAKAKWPHHYLPKGKKHDRRGSGSMDGEDSYVHDVKCHYYQANVVGFIFNLGDCAYLKGEEGEQHYVGRILEFFETLDGTYYFTVQWFFRAEDTVLKGHGSLHDKRRLFYSDLKNDNRLDCIVSKVEVMQLFPNEDVKSNSVASCDYYCDMKYSLDYSTFHVLPVENGSEENGQMPLSTCPGKAQGNMECEPFGKCFRNESVCDKSEITLLDLYSGCGGMSTGLCLGAHAAGLNVTPKWAVDLNESACKSLKLNHPQTTVRNESGTDFLDLLKEWNKLCKRHLVDDTRKSRRSAFERSDPQSSDSKSDSHGISDVSNGEYEVLKVVDICYGDPNDSGKRGLKFKVRWKGYSPSEDTWEPMDNLRNTQDAIHDFVRHGYKARILPRPGEVDVICGGPPCQGISGLNRHRNVDAPLEDEKNKQIIVFMDIVQFLKPTYVLMENVVDILKFANGTLGRYALSRLVHMKYQARLGIMAAGTYGLPQFRMRAFFWGSHPSKMLPQFPLPTHDVVVKGGAPNEFERNLVAFNEDQPRNLEKPLVLKDALSDLPAVNHHEARNEMVYGQPPQTEFQKYIRSFKNDLFASSKKNRSSILYDHIPWHTGEDNYARISQVPKRKGACFRDLPGVVVLPDKSVQRDPTMKRVLLPSGRLLVPDYCFTFEGGKSTRPFARLWWDEIVPTVFTSADPHFQAIVHPEQDRVLTIRENARLQGFPDCYRLCGSVKERYRQVGNAVAVSVGRALGYAMALAWKKIPTGKDEPLMFLPPNFSLSHQHSQPH